MLGGWARLQGTGPPPLCCASARDEKKEFSRERAHARERSPQSDRTITTYLRTREALKRRHELLAFLGMGMVCLIVFGANKDAVALHVGLDLDKVVLLRRFLPLRRERKPACQHQPPQQTSGARLLARANILTTTASQHSTALRPHASSSLLTGFEAQPIPAAETGTRRKQAQPHSPNPQAGVHAGAPQPTTHAAIPPQEGAQAGSA